MVETDGVASAHKRAPSQRTPLGPELTWVRCSEERAGPERFARESVGFTSGTKATGLRDA